MSSLNRLSSSKSGLRARIMESHNNSDDICYVDVLLVMLSCTIEIFDNILIRIDANLIELLDICCVLAIKAIIGSILIDNLMLMAARQTIFFNVFIVRCITQCANNVSFGVDKYDTLLLIIIDITSTLIGIDTITRDGFKTTSDLCKMVNVSSCRNFCLSHINPVVNCWYCDFLIDYVLTMVLSCIIIQFIMYQFIQFEY